MRSGITAAASRVVAPTGSPLNFVYALQDLGGLENYDVFHYCYFTPSRIYYLFPLIIDFSYRSLNHLKCIKFHLI